MLKSSLTKENLKSLENYPVLGRFLEDIKKKTKISQN